VTIANLQRELKKAKTSEAMACMAVTEHQAEMEEIQEALDVARADANAKDVELARMMGSLETMRSDLAQGTAELETSRSEVVVLRTADSELRTQVEKIQAELAAATSEVTELKASSAGIQQELDMARTAETTIRGQLDSTRAEAELLQEQLVTARQHAAESSAATIASLESDKTTLEARTKDLEDQLSEILDKLASGEKKRAETESTSGAELEEAKDRVVELEKVVVGKEEEIAQLKAQAETLVEELTQVESAHEEAIKRASDELGNKEKAHDEALKAMEEQREELRTQLEQDVNKSTELGSRLSAVQAEFEAEKIRAEAAHASSQERQSIIDDLRKTVSELENTSSQAGDKCSALEVQIAELQATAVSASEKEATRIVEMQQLEKAHSEAQASLTDMKTRLQQAETSSAGNDDVVKALREEVDKLAKQSKQAAGLLKFQENETKTM
jgi:chromosome segregation ATPase